MKNMFIAVSPEMIERSQLQLSRKGLREILTFDASFMKDFISAMRKWAEIERQKRIEMAKRAVDSQIDKFKANWPGNELYLEVYEFEDNITVKRVNDPWGVPAAKRAFDSILNGYAK